MGPRSRQQTHITATTQIIEVRRNGSLMSGELVLVGCAGTCTRGVPKHACGLARPQRSTVSAAAAAAAALAPTTAPLPAVITAACLSLCSRTACPGGSSSSSSSRRARRTQVTRASTQGQYVFSTSPSRVVGQSAATVSPSAASTASAARFVSSGSRRRTTAAKAGNGSGGGGGSGSGKDEGDWRQVVLAAAADPEGFVELTVRPKVQGVGRGGGALVGDLAVGRPGWAALRPVMGRSVSRRPGIALCVEEPTYMLG